MTAPHLQRTGVSLRVVLAWLVHFYTATGLIAAAAIAVLLSGPATSPAEFRWAFVLMFTATLIDATDGTLARMVGVKEVTPHFDGRRLDDLTDFLTYTFLPLFLICRAELLPPGQSAWLLAPLLASAYGFCQVSAKTPDGYFLGFPSYWNIVAFYLYLLHLPGWLNLAIVLFFAAMTFLPCRYPYPTHRGHLNRITLYLSVIWAVLLVWILAKFPDQTLSAETSPDHSVRLSVLLSLSLPAYYLLQSWALSYHIWQRARRERIAAITDAEEKTRTSTPITGTRS